jgi:hypothetical protein
MRPVLVFAFAALIGVAASPGAARATIYSTQASYAAAAAGGTSQLVTFEDVAVPNDPLNTFNNIVAIAANRYPGLSLPNASVVGTHFAFGVASQALAGNSATLAIGLTDPSTFAVGFNLAVFGGGDATVTVLDGSTILASTTVTTDDETVFDSFFGYVGTAPVTAVDITPVDTTTVALVDNLQFSVPEPASAALLFGGLTGLAAIRRRR